MSLIQNDAENVKVTGCFNLLSDAWAGRHYSVISCPIIHILLQRIAESYQCVCMVEYRRNLFYPWQRVGLPACFLVIILVYFFIWAIFRHRICDFISLVLTTVSLMQTSLHCPSLCDLRATLVVESVLPAPSTLSPNPTTSEHNTSDSFARMF